MATRNIVLTEQQDQLINDLVTKGRYQNASEALRAGVRLLEEKEAALDALRDHLAESIAQAERGEFADGSGEEAIRNAFAEARLRRTA